MGGYDDSIGNIGLFGGVQPSGGRMPKPLRKHIYKGLALLSATPFLMGFEPRRDEGLTVGVGGSAGRGHYSTGCAQQRYQQEYAAGSVSLGYTFAHDSAQVYRPRVTVGGALSIAGTETKLIADEDADPAWVAANSPTVVRQSMMAGFLLRLDWAYLGLGAGGVFAVPEWQQNTLDAPVLPAGEVRLGPWKNVYATASVGGGFAMPVLLPFDIAGGLGWQGRHFGAWLGRAISGYGAPENLLTLSYRFHRVTVLGSMGLFSEDEGAFLGHYEFGEYSRAAVGLRFNL